MDDIQVFLAARPPRNRRRLINGGHRGSTSRAPIMRVAGQLAVPAPAPVCVCVCGLIIASLGPVVNYGSANFSSRLDIRSAPSAWAHYRARRPARAPQTTGRHGGDKSALPLPPPPRFRLRAGRLAYLGRPIGRLSSA